MARRGTTLWSSILPATALALAIVATGPTGCQDKKTTNVMSSPAGTTQGVLIGGIFERGSGTSDTWSIFGKQLPVAASVVNDGGGVLGGRPVEVAALYYSLSERQGNPNRPAELVSDLAAMGAVAILGSSGSPETVTAASEAIRLGIPFSAQQASTDALSGCPANWPQNQRSAVPVYDASGVLLWDHKGLFFRTRNTGVEWGRLNAAFLRVRSPADVTAAHMRRNDTAGIPVSDGFVNEFKSRGGKVIATVGFTGGSATPEYREIVRGLVANGAPRFVTGLVSETQLKLFLKEWAAMERGDSTVVMPAGATEVKFYFSATITGNYSDLRTGDASAFNILTSRVFSFHQSWDQTSQGYKDWLALWTKFDPSHASVKVQWEPAAFDAVMILALAMERARSTRGSDIAQHVLAVANPPGMPILPGDYRAARLLIGQGKDIDYVGATGIDLDERGDLVGAVYALVQISSDATTTLIKEDGLKLSSFP